MQLNKPPVQFSADDFVFKKWFNDVYNYTNSGLLIPNGGSSGNAQEGTANSLTPLFYPSRRNLLYNGAMQIWQRGTTVTDTGTTTYGPDRWAFTGLAAGRTICSLSSTVFAANAAKLVRNATDTNTGAIYFATALPNEDVLYVQGKYVTLSMWIQGLSGFTPQTTFPNSQAMELTIQSGTVANQGPFAAFTGSVFLAHAYYTPNKTGPIFVTCSGFVPSNAQSLKCYISFQPTAVAGANNGVLISNIQLEIGQQATAYDLLRFEEDYQRCLKFYRKTFPYSTTPVQNVGSLTGCDGWTSTSSTLSATQFSPTFNFMVPMFTGLTPIITTYNPKAANANAWNNRALNSPATFSVANKSEKNIQYTLATVSGWVVGDPLYIHTTIDADLR